MSAHRAKLSSAILFLLTASLLTTACANDPTGPSIDSPTPCIHRSPTWIPHTTSRSRGGAADSGRGRPSGEGLGKQGVRRYLRAADRGGFTRVSRTRINSF